MSSTAKHQQQPIRSSPTFNISSVSPNKPHVFVTSRRHTPPIPPPPLLQIPNGVIINNDHHGGHHEDSPIVTTLSVPKLIVPPSLSPSLATIEERKAPLADDETASEINDTGNNNINLDIIDLKQSSQFSSSNNQNNQHHHNNNRSTSSSSSSNRLQLMDMNMYATRKTIAQGIMDLGLMCANASQLKYVLINANNHRYFQVTVSLIVISILMQIIVGIMFIALGRLNINFVCDRRRADMLNNASVIVIFLVTVINVLITAFGPSDTIQSTSTLIPSTSLYHHGINSDH